MMTRWRIDDLRCGDGFDEATAAALGVVTLCASETRGGESVTGPAVEDLLARPGGDKELVRGLVAVCGGLLALLEFYGGVRPEQGLIELGRAIALATARPFDTAGTRA